MNSLPQITIKPSKQWVLPPRPRPGRKPNDDLTKTKQKKKKDDSIDSALKLIKDENKQLKQELSKLVLDLKQLQSKHKDTKKRNHLQMEREDSLYSSSSSPSEENYLVRQSTYTSEDDEIASQISSAPSLVSSSSSLNSHSLLLSNSLSSLTSIKEEEANALKIDEFLTTSYFDNSSNLNSISNDHQTNVDQLILKEKLKLINPSTDNDFEFNFLKNEKLINNNNTNNLSDSNLFDIKIEEDFFQWN